MYGIRAIPHMYLIDGEGVVRKSGVRGPALEPAIAELDPRKQREITRRQTGWEIASKRPRSC